MCWSKAGSRATRDRSLERYSRQNRHTWPPSIKVLVDDPKVERYFLALGESENLG
jgi:hypothetical protein